MKKFLLATSILAGTAGLAAAEVTLSGDARMGIIDNFGPDNTGFTSRARVKFTLSGETDGGLSYGATFRADNAATESSCSDDDGDGIVEPAECGISNGANVGNAGEVFISGAFGKLTMGDIDGAAQQAVGNVDGVGLTGLGDLNEAVYLHNLTDGAALDPSVAYEYSTGGFTAIISAQNPDNNIFAGADADPTLALGLKYAMGDYSFALGYESNNDFLDLDHVIIGATATFGAVTVKGNYGRLNTGFGDVDQWHLSTTYTADALAVTAFYSDEDGFQQAYGLGASYDLGDGAKVVGGYAVDDSDNTNAFDLGLSFSF